jgi:dipeptidyl aminopeptidase/acylaminoacyl peptidase
MRPDPISRLPDGRYLAFKRDNSDEDVFVGILAVDSAEYRELVPDIPGGIAYQPFLSWSRDGRSLIVDGARNPTAPALKGAHLVDALTGETTTVISKAPNTVVTNHVKALLNGQAVVYLESWRRVVTRDLETGDERTVYDAGASSALDSLALSPDGMTVAFRDRTRRAIQVVALAGGAPRTLASTHELRSGENEEAVIDWSADGRYVIFSNYNPTERQDGLWRVPAAGGTPESLGFTTDQPIREVAVQPNGRSVVVVMSNGEPPGIRVMEGLAVGPR